MEKLAVVYKKVDDLIPYARNARTHSEEQVTRIASSIKEFGFTNPILLDGENGVIAGHGRLLASKKLGLTEVPCIELAGLTKTQKQAYILADNKLALDAGWDEEMLRLELDELRENNFNIDLTGFGKDEVKLLDDGIEDEVNDELNDAYSQAEGKILYEPKETNHSAKDLFQTKSDSDLINEIEAIEDNNLQTLFKQRLAWFTKFQYEKIADYYAYQATPQEQRLFERLGLVLLDKDGLIENGFADIQKHIDS